jgi:sugar/nucleoside kinase (ribokinase family)
VDLACVGDVMLDVRADAGTLATGGDVHGRVNVQPGGTSANAAVWAASAGATATVIGAIGDDVAGDLLATALTRHDVATDMLARRPSPTGTMLVLHEAGERSMVADRGANASVRPEDLPTVIDAAAVLVSGYLLLQAPTTDAALAAIDRARGDLVVVEAASWPLVEAFGVEAFLEAASRATGVLANAREARTLTSREPEGACRWLGERFRLVAVKRGAEGACMSLDGSFVIAPSPRVAEVDPTGAGDAFDGVLLAMLAHGADPERALAASCDAGARVASSSSAWPDPPQVRT